jgi:hypothetical protein
VDSTRIQAPKPLQTFVFLYSDGRAGIIRHWTPADALDCRRCEGCRAYPGTEPELMVCAMQVPRTDVAAHCFG